MDTARQIKYKILLVGDNGVDQYQYGTVNRISPEAPVPIIDYSHTETKPGMAANVKENLEALGCKVNFKHGNRTCVKTRIIDLKSKQQLVRIDQDQTSKPVKLDYNTINKYDSVVISDYNKGSVTCDTINDILTNYTGPVFIDTKKQDLSQFENCVFKINSLEYSKLKSLPKKNTDLIVTHGEKGVFYNDEWFSPVKVEVNDVCGAGDTFLAALVYGFLTYNSMRSAIEFANKASAVTIQHVGVYAPTLKEIND